MNNLVKTVSPETLKNKCQYGLQLSRSFRHGNETVHARVVAQDWDEDKQELVGYPRGCDYDHPNDMQMGSLGVYGFVTKDRCEFLPGDVIFMEPYTVNQRMAERMLRSLRKVHNQITKDGASEPGDVLMSLCKALKLRFMVEQVGSSTGWRFQDSDWRFMTLKEGRERYRQMIELAKVEQAARQKLGAHEGAV